MTHFKFVIMFLVSNKITQRYFLERKKKIQEQQISNFSFAR